MNDMLPLQTMGTSLDQMVVSETEPLLLVFDGMTALPDSKPLLKLMENRHAHFVVLHKDYQPPDKLIQAIDHQLLRGSKVHVIETLSMIRSTQRTVYTIQREIDLAPNNQDQDVLEKLAEFTSGSPVLVDITSQLIISRLKNSLETSHTELKLFADSISLDTTRKVHTVEKSHLGMREMSAAVRDLLPPAEPTAELRDNWDTKCQYDSWDAITELMGSCNLQSEEELLLNCLSLFGCSPVPVAFATSLSSLVCKTSGRPHLATSLLHNLMKMNFVKAYPLPVVIHHSLKLAPESEPDFVYVPQYIANFLWKVLGDMDKMVAIATSYLTVSSLSASSLTPQFLLPLSSLLLDACEVNLHLLNAACYGKIYGLYLSLLQEV